MLCEKFYASEGFEERRNFIFFLLITNINCVAFKFKYEHFFRWKFELENFFKFMFLNMKSLILTIFLFKPDLLINYKLL